MDDLATLGFVVKDDGLRKGERALDKFARKGEAAEKRVSRASVRMSSGFMSLSKSINVAGAAMAALGLGLSVYQLVTVTREFNVLDAQLKTATGSAKNAEEAFKWIQDFAANTPYDLAQVTGAFVQLKNLGLDPSEKALQSYGNTAAAMGKSLNQFIEAVADASTGEFERLKEFGIKASSEGDKVKLTFRGVTTEIGKNSQEIESYLMRLGEVEFAGAMEERTKTLDGAISNLADTWDSLFLTVSSKGVGSVIEDSVRTATDGIQLLIDTINAGVIEHVADTISLPFERFTNSVSTSFNFLSGFIGETTDGWWESFKSFYLNVQTGMLFLPETIATMIERVGLNMSALADVAKIYGGMFVDLLAENFNKVVDIGTIYTRKLVSVLNPMASEYNLMQNLTDTSLHYNDSIAQIVKSATERAGVVTSALDKETSAIKQSLQASKDDFKSRMIMTSSLIDIYKKRVAEESEGRGGASGLKITNSDVAIQSAYTKEYQRWIQSVNDAANPIEVLEEEIRSLWEAMLDGDITMDVGRKRISQLQEQIESIKPPEFDLFSGITNGASEALKSVQGLSAQGSKEYKKLGIAIQAISAAQAIYNVLNQGSGDPYSAFPRMAAMASAMASLGFSVAGAFGGSVDDGGNLQEIQANQGLNQWGEKAESISDSVSMIESATGDLVGINSDMLKALKNLQVSLGGASNIIARDITTPQVNQSGLVPDLSKGMESYLKLTPLSLISKPLGNLFGSLFGGSSKVTNEGINIVGGTIESLINDVVVQSFQTVSYKKWRFGSRKTKTVTQDISNQVGAQFELVFESLAQSVLTGATALGVNEKAASDSISRFVVGTINLSLKGLSADQKSQAIENAFSQIFNNLTVAVVPWITKLQKAGEELGTTLSRIATEVAIADLMASQFGINFGDKLANPEMYATAIDGLTELAGGVEALGKSTSSFIENFAPEATKIDILNKSLTDSFKAVGLELPSTSKAMWDLMGTLDGTTEEGRKQIATLLNLQDSASDYFKLLDKQNDSYVKLADSLASAAMSMYDLDQAAKTVTLDNALAAARGGDFTLAKELKTGQLAPSAGDFSSLAEYELAKASTANKMLELAGLAESQTDVQSEQLNVLREINQAIRTNYNMPPSSTNETKKQMEKQSRDFEELKFASVSNAKTNAKMASDINSILNVGIPTYEG